ncbi:MAG: multidrug effflux MFS transporter [Pseudoxanthomonas mexicana]|nr:multidrug effflux MFS transporter [Pseudoxanthomonas mexicana]
MRDSLFRMAFVLGLLTAVGPFAIDMYLPALPAMAGDLATTESVATLTLAIYFLSFGLAQMVYGPLSDAMGRKRPMIIGALIFTVASIAAGCAPSIDWLIAARAVQGFGAAALMVVPRAVIRDVASGPAAARAMAAIMMVLSISPLLAPLAGSMVLAWSSWRGIFLILAMASLLSLPLIQFALPETLSSIHQRPVRVAPIWAGIKRLLSDRRFMGLTMMAAFGIASLFVFISAASFVYSQQYGLSPTEFSFAFAANAVGFFIASQFAGRLSERFGMGRVISWAVTGLAMCSLVLAGVIWMGLDTLPVLMAGLGLVFTCLGLVVPTAMVMSLDPHPDIAGLAASIGGSAQMVTGAVMIALSSPFMDSSALTMTAAIAVCTCLAWVASTLSKALGDPHTRIAPVPDRH